MLLFEVVLELVSGILRLDFLFIADVVRVIIIARRILRIQVVDDSAVVLAGRALLRIELHFILFVLSAARAFITHVQLFGNDELLALELDVVHELGRGRCLQARRGYGRVVLEHVQLAVGHRRVGVGVAGLLFVVLVRHAGLRHLLRLAGTALVGRAVGRRRALLLLERRRRTRRSTWAHVCALIIK